MSLIQLLEWFAAQMKLDRYGKSRREESENILRNMGVDPAIVRAISASIDDRGDYVRIRV